MMLAPHTSPRATVNRAMLRSATEEPLSVEDIPPPNMSDRPPPLPLCNRTNRVSSSPPTTRSTCNPIFTTVTKVRPNLVRCQSRRQERPQAQGTRRPCRSHPTSRRVAGRPRPAGSRRRPRGPITVANPRRAYSAGGDVVAVTADRHEVVRHDRRATDQRSIHVGLGHDLGDVARLDRTAVKDADAVGGITGVELGQPRTDRRTDLLCVRRGRHLAGPDGPDRLVGDDDGAHLLGGDTI